MIKRVHGYLTVRRDPVPEETRALHERGFASIRAAFDADAVAELRADVERVFAEEPADARLSTRSGIGRSGACSRPAGAASAGGKLAKLSGRRAIHLTRTAPRVALAEIVDRHTCDSRLAIVSVGQAVTAAHGKPNRGAESAAERRTYALEITTARSDGQFAEIGWGGTWHAPQPAANLAKRLWVVGRVRTGGAGTARRASGCRAARSLQLGTIAAWHTACFHGAAVRVGAMKTTAPTIAFRVGYHLTGFEWDRPVTDVDATTAGTLEVRLGFQSQ